MIIKVRDMIRLIEEDGWFLAVYRGSHRQFKHSTKKGRVTINGKPNDDLDDNLTNSVLKQAGLNKDEIRNRNR